MAFHQPPASNDFDDSPYPYDTSQILMHICETMRYRVSIGGVATIPPSEDEGLRVSR